MARTPLNRRTQNRLSLARFLCTALIATFFAKLGQPALQLPLLRSFLLIAAILTLLLALLQRERPLAPALNRWDEVAGFYALMVLVDLIWRMMAPETSWR